jgi:tetratricopeptide (TPR) repeat protein
MKTMNNLALAYRDCGRLPEALTLYEETLTRSRTKLGPNHPFTLQVTKNLAAAYQAAGRLSEALPLFEAALKGRQAQLGPDHPDTLDSMSQFARACLVANPAQAETLLLQALAILDKKFPDGWQSFETRSLLGASLLGQKKYAQAEPFLLQGYEGMKAREAKIPALNKRNLHEAGTRIVTLYNAWGKADKVEEWTKKLDSPPKK